MTTYTTVAASEIVVGDKVRPLVTIGPSDPRPGAEDAPWTVARIQTLHTPGRIRIWAHPFGSHTQTTSPANYGNFAAATDQIDRAD